MRILLINPPFTALGGSGIQGGALMPLNLCYLASHTRQQIPEVLISVIDAEMEGLSLEETAENAQMVSPDIIGITTTTPSFEAVIQLTHMLRGQLPKVIVVLGGPHVSALPERSLRETSADYVVIGEGEQTFTELVRVLGCGGKEISAISGLAYFYKEQFILTPQRELIKDLDSLPIPARDLIGNARYSPPPSKRVARGPNTLISTSRGCFHNCGFCGCRSIWRRRIRTRKPESVIAEIREIIERYNIATINFTDEYFTAKRERVHTICKMIIEHDLVIPWVCSSRAENLDEETLQLMKRAGCREISFGIESGNNEILMRIDKKLNLQESERVVNAARRAGISTHASYIIGYPGETSQSAQDTIDFAIKLNTDVAAFFIASPLPGSRLYDEALNKGYLIEDIGWQHFSPLSNFDPAMQIGTLSTEKVKALHRKAYKRYYLRPWYVASRLFRIRHWYEVQNLFEGLRAFLKIE